MAEDREAAPGSGAAAMRIWCRRSRGAGLRGEVSEGALLLQRTCVLFLTALSPDSQESGETMGISFLGSKIEEDGLTKAQLPKEHVYKHGG